MIVCTVLDQEPTHETTVTIPRFLSHAWLDSTDTMHGTEDLPEQADSGIDFQAALAMAGGDVELLRELAGAFLDEVPKLLHALRMAVGQRDSESLQATAHQLQGVMRCLHVEHALEQARQLELLGEGETNWPAAENMLAETTATVASVMNALNEFLGERA